MKQYISYKDSGVEWIGEIPSKWSIEKPKYILKKVTREIKNTDEIITCFRDGTVTLRKNRREEGFTISLKEIGYQRIHEGDLVIHEMDGFEGSIGVSDSVGKSSPVYTVISPSEEYEVQYWMYLLREMAQTRFIASLAKSIRERTSEFRWNVWRSLYFPIPPIPEQKQIAGYLDKETDRIDSLIERAKRKIELLKEQRESIINQAVTKGLDPNVEMKDSGVEWIGEIPTGWKSIKLKYIFYEKELIHNPKLGCGSISFGKVITKDDDKIPITTKESYQELLKGEYLINPLNLNYDLKSLRIALSELNVVVSSGYMVIKECIEINKSYFKWLLHIYDVFHMKLLGSGVRQTINFNDISNSFLTFPPLQEQKQIAGYLDKETDRIDSLAELESKRMELREEYRQSLISNAVTGKIDVRGMN